MYIHQLQCISAQDSFQKSLQHVLENKVYSNDLQLIVKEPNYTGILPLNLLRRMGKAARISVATGMDVIANSPHPPNGIILGSGYGGLEDNLLFLKQIIEYDEGRLTPTHFVSSMPSALLAPIILMTSLRGYNVVHTQKGFAFEQAAIDAEMYCKENPNDYILLGATDELTESNYNPMKTLGLLSEMENSNLKLDGLQHTGYIPGEASIYFMVSNKADHAIAKIEILATLFADDIEDIKPKIQNAFINSNPDLILAGYNYDHQNNSRLNEMLKVIPAQTPVAGFKDLSGEFPCASAFAVWMASQLIKEQSAFPLEFINDKQFPSALNEIIILNSYQRSYHTIIKITKP